MDMDMDDIRVESELINVSSKHAMYEVMHTFQERSDTDSTSEFGLVDVSPANNSFETKFGKEIFPQKLKEDLDKF